MKTVQLIGGLLVAVLWIVGSGMVIVGLCGDENPAIPMSNFRFFGTKIALILAGAIIIGIGRLINRPVTPNPPPRQFSVE